MPLKYHFPLLPSCRYGAWLACSARSSLRSAAALTSTHGRSCPRFLVRFRLDLFVSGGGSNSAARRCSQGASALPALSARPDLQGAGLGHLAVQSLRGQGPLHVARHGAAGRGAVAAVSPPRPISAEQP